MEHLTTSSATNATDLFVDAIRAGDTELVKALLPELARWGYVQAHDVRMDGSHHGANCSPTNPDCRRDA